MHRGEIRFGCLIAMHDAQCDPGIAHLAALLADVLAVLVVHRREEIVEAFPAGFVVPVVLDVLAQQPASVEGCLIRFSMEIHVRGRQPGFACEPRDGIDHVALRGFIARQQARPGHRRVGDRAQPFRVVIQPVLRERMRPGMVEHEFAVRVGLEIARRRGDQRTGLSMKDASTGTRVMPRIIDAAMAKVLV